VSLEALDRYLVEVQEGRRVVGRLERLAVERHARDLERGAARGLRFDRERAAHAMRFFRFLKHSKGEWAGKAIALEGWQAFLVGSTFGWIRSDGTRRFRVSLCFVARKNGKSTIGAGVGLYLLVADEEPGAEVYTAATKRDQARIVHAEAVRMVKASPALLRRIRSYKDNLHVPGTASKYEPLGADADTLDGLNIHGAIIDELHAHKNRELWDVIETATGARRQPLLFGITTAGQELESLCGHLYLYTRQILEGALEDDTHFGYIAELDEGDDWADPSVWAKANPNLGVSVKLEGLAEQAEKAKAEPGAQNAFRRLRCNQWVAGTTAYLDPRVWQACAGELSPEALLAGMAGRGCYAGVDLASTIDLAALAIVAIPEGEGPFDAFVRCYMPEDVARDPEKRRRDRVPYDLWVEQGWITATPGNVIDYAWIRSDLERLAGELQILQVGYDPWNALQFATECGEELGLDMVPIRQGFPSLNAPTKELLKLVVSGRLRHGGNPVLAWQAANLTIRIDPAGNVKPDREKSRAKIDGIVALIMAIDRACRNEGSPVSGSVYRERGVLVL